LEDEHVPNLLLFNPQARFHEEETYQSGKIILQDKASCFPATVLVQDIQEPHGDFIDATAAPGNKTTHLSALLGNKTKVRIIVSRWLADLRANLAHCYDA
jgi:putative methyltransferase